MAKLGYESFIKNIQDEKYKNLHLEKMKLKQLFSLSQIEQETEKLKKELEKIEKLQKSVKVLSSYDFTQFKEKIFAPKNELETVLKRVKKISPKEYERVKKLDIDEKLKLKEAKVIYQRLLYTQIFKSEIEAVLEDAPVALKEKFKKLQAKEIIYKDEYEKLMDEYYNQESNEVSIDKITQAFEEMGYKFESVVENEKGYINTDKEDYKIAYRIENGKLSLAVTRFVDGNIKINEYEKAKDKEFAKKWCSDFEKISELLEKEGILLHKEMLKEPDEVDIIYEKIDGKLKEEKAKQEKSIKY